MDGVIHETDAILLPPVMDRDASRGEKSTTWLTSLFGLGNQGAKLTVAELMERLQPLIAEDGQL